MFSDDDDWGGDSDEDLDARYGIGTGADDFEESNDMFERTSALKPVKNDTNPTTSIIQAPTSPMPPPPPQPVLLLLPLATQQLNTAQQPLHEPIMLLLTSQSRLPLLCCWRL